uniref:AEC family transporter n=2 Tax=Yoonia sp. TaxID=2212373 RepID=UPI004048739E
MNLALTVLNITAPVFILGAVGYIWVRLGFEYRVEFVTRLTMTLSVPCLIFVALMTAQIDPTALAALSIASFVAYAIVSVVFIVVLKLRGLPFSTYLAPLVFGNTGNLGLPLALFAFGEAGLSYAVVVFAVMAILSFTIGVWVVSGGGSLMRVVKEPIVAATVLGALFLWQGWSTPVFLTNALELIGQMAIPIMLITLGVAVARLETRDMGQAVWLSGLKALVCAAAAWFAARWMGLAPIPTAVLIVQISTPVAVTSYLLAEKYGTEAQPVAGMVVASTILSVITLPLILAFVI